MKSKVQTNGEKRTVRRPSSQKRNPEITPAPAEPVNRLPDGFMSAWSFGPYGNGDTLAFDPNGSLVRHRDAKAETISIPKAVAWLKDQVAKRAESYGTDQEIDCVWGDGGFIEFLDRIEKLLSDPNHAAMVLADQKSRFSLRVEMDHWDAVTIGRIALAEGHDFETAFNDVVNGNHAQTFNDVVNAYWEDLEKQKSAAPTAG